MEEMLKGVELTSEENGEAIKDAIKEAALSRLEGELLREAEIADADGQKAKAKVAADLGQVAGSYESSEIIEQLIDKTLAKLNPGEKEAYMKQLIARHYKINHSKASSEEIMPYKILEEQAEALDKRMGTVQKAIERYRVKPYMSGYTFIDSPGNIESLRELETAKVLDELTAEIYIASLKKIGEALPERLKDSRSFRDYIVRNPFREIRYWFKDPEVQYNLELERQCLDKCQNLEFDITNAIKAAEDIKRQMDAPDRINKRYQDRLAEINLRRKNGQSYIADSIKILEETLGIVKGESTGEPRPLAGTPDSS